MVVRPIRKHNKYGLLFPEQIGETCDVLSLAKQGAVQGNAFGIAFRNAAEETYAHDSRNPQIDKEFAKEGRCKGRFASAGSGMQSLTTIKIDCLYEGVYTFLEGVLDVGCENDESLKGLAIGSLKILGSKKGMMMSKRDVTTHGSGESLLRGQMLNEIIVALNQEEKDKTSRILFIDFYEKSKDSDVSECNSVLTCEGYDGVHLCGLFSEDYEEVGDEGLDKLCEEMSKITVNKVTAKFTRKHIRFAYNSDGELAGE
ncbi:hypothetical protein Tco_1157128 [Tanacetum coccineum]